MILLTLGALELLELYKYICCKERLVC